MLSRILWLVGVPLFVLVTGTYGVDAEDQPGEKAKMTTRELLAKADEVFKSRKYEASREIYQQAAEAAQAAGETSDLTEAKAMLARTYLILNQKKEGRPLIAEAEKTATPDEPPGWSRYLGVRGRFEWQDKQLEKATATFKEMYTFCVEHKLHERAIDAAHMVAITGTHEQQVEWSKKGIAEAEAGQITGWLGPLWNNLGATHEEMDEFSKSLEAYLKAREYHWLYGDEKNKLIADWAVGHAYRLNGDLEKVGQWLRPVLAWCERIGENEFLGWSCKELGEIELAQNDHQTALEYLRRARDKLQQAGMPDWDAEGYKKLADQVEKLQASSGKSPPPGK